MGVTQGQPEEMRFATEILRSKWLLSVMWRPQLAWIRFGWMSIESMNEQRKGNRNDKR